MKTPQKRIDQLFDIINNDIKKKQILGVFISQGHSHKHIKQYKPFFHSLFSLVKGLATLFDMFW